VINLQALIDDARQGRDETQPERRRYKCKVCERRFDDLSGTIFAGHHRPIRIRVLCLYLMGPKVSRYQIARELKLNKDDVQKMVKHLREGIVAAKPPAKLQDIVECDELYIVAGHKRKAAVLEKGAPIINRRA
jgi:transposase